MRTIVPPPEWKIACECGAVLAYVDQDVHYNKFRLDHYITCPHCETEVSVPEEPNCRKSVEEGE